MELREGEPEKKNPNQTPKTPNKETNKIYKNQNTNGKKAATVWKKFPDPYDAAGKNLSPT